MHVNRMNVRNQPRVKNKMPILYRRLYLVMTIRAVGLERYVGNNIIDEYRRATEMRLPLIVKLYIMKFIVRLRISG